MAIQTELLKTTISSSSLYISALVINIAFSCLCPCVVIIAIFKTFAIFNFFTVFDLADYLISIFSVVQLTAVFNTRPHPCSFITFIMFSCFAAFDFTLRPPSIISTQSTIYSKRCKRHFYSPHSTAITYSIIIINATVFVSTISNTNAYWQIIWLQYAKMYNVLLVAKFTGIACRVYFKSYMYVKSIKVHTQFIKYLLIVLKFRPRYRDKCENTQFFIRRNL